VEKEGVGEGGMWRDDWNVREIEESEEEREEEVGRDWREKGELGRNERETGWEEGQERRRSEGLERTEEE
jgi:hypothetical protein